MRFQLHKQERKRAENCCKTRFLEHSNENTFRDRKAEATQEKAGFSLTDEGTGDGEDRGQLGVRMTTFLVMGRRSNSGMVTAFNNVEPVDEILQKADRKGKKLRRGVGILNFIAGL